MSDQVKSGLQFIAAEVKNVSIPGSAGSQLVSLGDELCSKLLDLVLANYGHLPQWKLVELTHGLPEWENPNGSALPINPAVILRSAGYTDEEIDAVMGDWAETALAQSLAG